MTHDAKILGLGGVFYKVKDPEAYIAWWRTHMGASPTDWANFEWASDGQSRTMMSPFPADSTYLEPSSAQFMMNLRVDNVAALIDMARKGGAQIIGEVENTEYGIFGWFIDPEGIKIELWQEV